MFKLFTLVFDDNTTFSGGNYRETKWKEIPSDKSIRTIFYSLPTGDCLALANFKRIYHYIEATMDMTGKHKNKQRLEYSHILIERNNIILHYIINLRNSSVNLEFLSAESELISKLNPAGWKKGNLK